MEGVRTPGRWQALAIALTTARANALPAALATALSAAFAIALTAALALAPPAAAATLANWDALQQRQVVRAGLMQATGGSFAGASALSAADANAALQALAAALPSANPTAAATGSAASTGLAVATGPTAPTVAAAPTATPAPTIPTTPTAAHTAQNPVTLTTFDRMLVDQLGLAGVAAHVQNTARAAGLGPPGYFGTEVVTRFLGLRDNHPAGTDELELFPHDAITRAEAAWSLAQVLHFGDWNVAYASQTLSTFALPSMTPDQRQALRVAVSRIGYPYVWGGTTDDTSDGLAHGGFDCSGFAWRVFKVSGLPWGGEIRGRTAAEQAGEIPKRRRLQISQLQPGDLLFFGSAKFTSTATEANVIHEGIYLGDNWVIHSSAQGVYVLPLTGSWLGDSFAWGRRVIH